MRRYKIFKTVNQLSPFEILKISHMIETIKQPLFFKELACRYTSMNLTNKETALFYKLIYKIIF